MEKTGSVEKTLAENVKFFRKKLGLNQFQLAEKATVGMHIVQGLEECRNWPELKNIELIATALNLESADLFQDQSRVVKTPPGAKESLEALGSALGFDVNLKKSKDPLGGIPGDILRDLPRVTDLGAIRDAISADLKANGKLGKKKDAETA